MTIHVKYLTVSIANLTRLKMSPRTCTQWPRLLKLSPFSQMEKVTWRKFERTREILTIKTLVDIASYKAALIYRSWIIKKLL